MFFAAGFGFKYFHYGGHSAHKVANLCKIAATAPYRGLGRHLGCNPKVTKLLNKPQATYYKIFSGGFGFKYFHYGGHCAHRVANLCKNAATAPSRGTGGHLGCNPKVTKLLK